MRYNEIADPDDVLQEAFSLIFQAMSTGGGPFGAFRPYLYRTIRNVAVTWSRRKCAEPVGDSHDLDLAAGAPEGLDEYERLIEGSITGRAFASLPTRWQTVLWYCAVEALPPREIAPLMGLTANGVSALARRAKEGLRTAWLAAHINDENVKECCRSIVSRLPDFKRGHLPACDMDEVRTHLDRCMHCLLIEQELDCLSQKLPLILVPLVLGPAAAQGLALGAATAGSAATGSSLAGGLLANVFGTAKAVVLASPVTTTVVASVTAAACTAGLVLAGGGGPKDLLPSGVESGTTLPTPFAGGARETAGPGPQQKQDDPRGEQTAPGTDAEPDPTPTDSELGPITPRTAQPEVPPVDPDQGEMLDHTVLAPLPPSQVPEPPATILAPVVQAPHAGDRYVAVPLTGTADPRGWVHVVVGEEVVATTAVQPDGTWSLVVPPIAGSYAITTTVAEETSDSVLAGPYTFLAPKVLFPEPTGRISYVETDYDGNGLRDEIDVRFHGEPGHHVEIWFDNVGTGTIHTLTQQPLLRYKAGLGLGEHVMALRYIDPDSGLVGAWNEFTFTIAQAAGSSTQTTDEQAGQ